MLISTPKREVVLRSDFRDLDLGGFYSQGSRKGRIMNYTRRDFGKLAIAAAALPAVSLQAKPNSNFNGVQIGIIVSYSYREMPDANDAMAILKHLVDDGLSA